MKIGASLGLAVLAAATAGAAKPETPRPAITGISHIAVYTSDAPAADHFYGTILGGRKATDPENAAGVRYYFSPQQFVEVLPLPANAGINRLSHTAYNTVDAAGLRRWVIAHGVDTASKLEKGADGSSWFSTFDPEGNEVQFVQPATQDATAEPTAISGRMIHLGFMAKDRARLDTFYRTVFGFRPYWYGSMKDDHLDWISQQVPDGRDWLEYMMVGGTSTVTPDRVDQRELGVLNHFSLGVTNMEASVTQLFRENRMSQRRDGPQMGRDGKWQTNLYDPDGTRVELMEWHASTKPCCSEFTAEDPNG